MLTCLGCCIHSLSHSLTPSLASGDLPSSGGPSAPRATRKAGPPPPPPPPPGDDIHTHQRRTGAPVDDDETFSSKPQSFDPVPCRSSQQGYLSEAAPTPQPPPLEKGPPSWSALARQQSSLRGHPLMHSHSAHSFLRPQSNVGGPAAGMRLGSTDAGYSRHTGGNVGTAQQGPSRQRASTCTYIRVTGDQRTVVQVPRPSLPQQQQGRARTNW
jgi:hypothetical protein